VPLFQQFQGKELGAILRHTHELSQEVGRRVPADKAIQLPTDPKAPEWEGVFAKLRPESPDTYRFQAPDALHWTPDELTGIKQGFWNAGLNEAQATRMMDFLAEGSKVEAEAEEQALAAQRLADEKTLRDKFGQDYDIRMEQATRVLKEFGALEHVTKLALDRDPVLMPLIAALGQLMGEGRMHTGMTGILGGASGGEAPETIQAKINQLRASDRWKHGSLESQKELEALTAQRLEAEQRGEASRAGRY